MRALTPSGLRELLAESVASTWFFGLKIHANPRDGWKEGDAVVYICNDNLPFEFDGQKYIAFPFEVTLAADDEETPPQCRIRFDNTTNSAAATVRGFHHGLIVWISVFRIGQDGTSSREVGPSKFTIQSVTITAETVEAVLGYDMDLLNEPAVHHRFTPATAPGLF